MCHWTFLLFNFLLLSALSCLATTIRSFVFSLILLTDFRLLNPVVSFLWFSEKMAVSTRNVVAEIEIL